MKQLLTFLLLVVHVNSAMLLPQVEDHGNEGAIGKTFDVVNSIYEWVDESVMDHHDSTTQDEHDEDDGLMLETPEADDFCSHMAFAGELISPVKAIQSKNAGSHASPAREMSYDTNTPPPEV